MEINKSTWQLQAVIEGSVQGVGFRAFTAEAAQRRHITGWVRNTYEGKVEIFAQGSRSNLEDFLKIIRSGPSLSEITNVICSWSEGSPEYKSFFIAKSKYKSIFAR